MKYTNQKMYNGRMITNTINKPLLHKKGKQWIVVGLSALMLAGFGGAIGLGHSTVHADTNTVQTSINKNLPQNNKQNSSASSNNIQSSANASNSNKATSTSTSKVTDQAKNLHANLLANATLAPVTGTNDSANNGQKNNQANANKHEEVVSEPEVGNASGTYLGMNYTSDGKGTVTLTGSFTGRASDFWSNGNSSYAFSDTPVSEAHKLVFGTSDEPVDFSSQPSLQNMFNDAPNGNVNEIDFNNVTGMNHVQNMNTMFGAGNSNLTTEYFGRGFNMSNVTDDGSMISKGTPKVSSFITYMNLKSDIASQISLSSFPGIKTGQYDGLNYIYDPTSKSVVFTSGTLDKWSDSSNGQNSSTISDSSKAFISPNSSAPSDLKNAEYIKFDNDVNTNVFYHNNGPKYLYNAFIVSDPNVRSINLGTNFDIAAPNADGGYGNNWMFADNNNLQSIIVPNYFVNSFDAAPNVFSNDNKLAEITVLSNPTEGSWVPQMEFGSNDGLSGNWRRLEDGGNSYGYQIGNGSTTLQPGTYVKSDSWDYRNYKNISQNPKNTSHQVAAPDFDKDSFTEGTSRVKYNSSNDTITFSGGTLDPNPQQKGTSSLAIPTKIFDNTTKRYVPSDLLPNGNNDWRIKFINVNAPSSMYFDLDGKNEDESTAGTSKTDPNRKTTSPYGQAQERKSRNFIGNQVSDIDLSGLNTNSTTNMQGFMINDYNLKHVNFGNINTSKVTNMAEMLGSDISLPYVDLSNLNGHSLNEAWDMLYNCHNLQGVKLSKQFSPHYENNNPVNKFNPVSIGEMFGSDPSLQFKNIDWNGFNTNKVTAFYGLFRSDYNLGDITLPASFDTSNGVNFGQSVPSKTEEAPGPDGMFQSDFSSKYSKGVTSIDLGPNFNTSKATDIAAMFRADKALKTIKFGNKFDTSNVSDMQEMFAYSDGISDLSLPVLFTMQPTTNTTSMFQSDAKVTSDSTTHQVKPYSGKLTTITINSPKTKIYSHNPTYNGGYVSGKYNTWGYWSDYNGSVDNVDPNRYFKETGKENSYGPTTVSTPVNFSDGNNVGTFTLKNVQPGTRTLPQDSDKILFSDVDPNDSHYGADFAKTVFGKNNAQRSVIGLIPKGFKLQADDPSAQYFTFDNGDHHFDIISANKPNTNIPVLENAVNVQGTIKLVFNKGHNEHDIYLPYSEQQTFSDGPKNILSDAEITASTPNDYVTTYKDIKDFNTSGYKYDNNAKNSDINFTPNATQAIYKNGSTPLIRHDVELDYSGNSENETVKFIYTHPSGSQSTVHSDSKSGTNGEQSSDNYMPLGYHMDPNSSAEYIFENGGTHIINIIPNWTNATVNYEVNGSGTPVGKATLSGNNSSATDASDTSVDITNTYHPRLPSGYSVNGSTTVNFNNGTYTINVTPASDTDEVVFRGDNNSDYSVSGSKGTPEKINPPAHFKFTNHNEDGYLSGNQGKFNLDGGHHYFSVARNSDTMNITFSDGNGNSIPGRTDKGLSDTSDVVVAPDNYHFSNVNGHDSKSKIIHYSGSGNPQNLKINVVGDKVNDDIVYVDHAGNYVSDKPVSGNYGVNDTTDIHAPNGYSLANGQGSTFKFNNGTHIVKVVGNKTDNIIYLDAQGNFQGSISQSGASDTSDNIDSGNKPNLFSGYQLVNGDNKFAYDGLTHFVPVEGTNESANITVKVHKIVNGNSDGSDTITLTRSGNVGSDVTIKPNDADVINNSHLPSGYLSGLVPDGRDYPRMGKLTASDKVNGINSPINFYYDRNSTNANAITVNYQLNGNTISSGSFNKTNGTQGNVTSDVSIPAGYKLNGNPNTRYTASNDPQTFNIPIVAKAANELPSDTNQGKVRMNLIFEDNSGNVQKVVTEYPNNVSNTKVGSDFTVNAPGETGYRQTSGGSQFKGHIYSYGAFPDTHSFVYQANPASTTVHFNNQNGSDVTPAGVHNNANGCTNGLANITLPNGYRLPMGTSYHFDSDNQLRDSNNDLVNNPLHVVGDKIVGNAKLHLIYKNGSNESDETATVPLSGEVGGTATINPYNYLRDNYQLNISNNYDGTGLAGRLTVNFTPSDVTNSDQHGFAYDPVYTFEYDSTAKKLSNDVEVVYENVNKGKEVVHQSDLGKFPNNSIGDTVLLAAKNTGVNNDKYYYDLTVPNGYHLEHTYNPITLTDDPVHAKATATRLGISIPNNVGMLLTVNLASTGTKPNKPTSSSANSNNNKPAKPASSSASSSNNVPPTPNSNSNGGGSVSPSSNGGGFIPNGGGFVPIPIPYPTPTPTPASNSNNTPHNSTVILPGSTTNNYYNNTTNNYYENNNSNHSSHYRRNTQKRVGRVYNLKGLDRIGVNQSVYYHGYKVTRLNVPAHFRWIYILKTCLAHKDLVNFGHYKNYRAVLRPNHRITLRINKVFKSQYGKKTYYNYEVRIGRHNCFVTGYPTYTRNAYYQPSDLRRTRSHGIFHHRYYRARLILSNGIYRSRYYTRRTFVRELHRGSVVHIKRVITIGRKGDFQTRFQLTNGDYVTSNKNWIRLI